ncbi:MAG: 2-C-methyl-D-erythritol 2,4-cyclodiphosphate synthase [Bdellovibrionales bacterium]|nr:2-C-methyl-D-erythritol 2,4-cyclodiphosphate synthase [Bdellovibrionales bacterium]
MTNGQLRIGQGIDVHQWEVGKELRLGGVSIPHPYGLKAHSDGDVLLHAIIDALCGAADLGDIGELFPDTSEEWQGADSRELLKDVMVRVHERGFMVVNVDSTIMAEAPKLQPYKPLIREQIASLLNVSSESVGVKATTCERMGFIGREEGIMAMAIVLLQKESAS